MDAARPPTGASSATTTTSARGPIAAPLRGRFAALLAAQARPHLRADDVAPRGAPPKAAPAAGPPRRPEGDAAAHARADERGTRDAEAVDDEPARRRHDAAADDNALDPQARHLAQLAPPVVMPSASTPSAAESAPARARSLEELVPELVRRIAWAGDGKRGTVRLELGAGAWAGANVIVHADGGRVRVELGGLGEHDLAKLRTRLATRLRGRGVDLEEIS